MYGAPNSSASSVHSSTMGRRIQRSWSALRACTAGQSSRPAASSNQRIDSDGNPSNTYPTLAGGSDSFAARRAVHGSPRTTGPDGAEAGPAPAGGSAGERACRGERDADSDHEHEPGSANRQRPGQPSGQRPPPGTGGGAGAPLQQHPAASQQQPDGRPAPAPPDREPDAARSR